MGLPRFSATRSFAVSQRATASGTLEIVSPGTNLLFTSNSFSQRSVTHRGQPGSKTISAENIWSRYSGTTLPADDPLVSFIVSCRDEDPALLEATLKGLISTTCGFRREVVLIDDGSKTPVACRATGIRIVRNPEPLGTCGARRLGAQIAEGNVLVWLDAHMSFTAGWLREMLAHVNSGSLLCSAFCSYDLCSCYCWGANFTWSGERNYSAHKFPGFGFAHLTEQPKSDCVEVPLVIGACYMMARSSYEQLGGFSPLYRIWGLEEHDLSIRAWMAGPGVRCVTGAKVGHLSRTAFPYPVENDHLEFNQMMLLQSLFEDETIGKLRQFFEPLSDTVQSWLSEVDLGVWRKRVQNKRRMNDAAFFARFLPLLFEKL